MSHLFLLSGVLAAGVAFFHFFLGGPVAARPLLETDKRDKLAKFTLYYCWHLVTIAIFALTAGFFVAVFDGTERTLALGATLVAAAFALWSLMMIVLFGLRFLLFPRWLLFLPAAVFGSLGLVT